MDKKVPTGNANKDIAENIFNGVLHHRFLRKKATIKISSTPRKIIRNMKSKTSDPGFISLGLITKYIEVDTTKTSKQNLRPQTIRRFIRAKASSFADLDSASFFSGDVPLDNEGVDAILIAMI